MNDRFNRNSHWPIYDKVPLELIKIVSDTVRREAPPEVPTEAREGVIESIKGIKGNDGLVVYFPYLKGRERE